MRFFNSLMPSEFQKSEDLRRRAAVALFASLWIAAAGIFFFALYGRLLHSRMVTTLISFSLTLVLAAPWVLLGRKSVFWSGHLLALALYTGFTAVSIGYYGEAVLWREWALLIPLLAIVIAGLPSGVFWCLLILLQEPLMLFLEGCCLQFESRAQPLPVLETGSRVTLLFVLTLLTGIYEVLNQRSLRHIQMLSEQDDLTGLANRRGFALLLGQLIKTARREKKQLAFIYMDLDGFKQINDRFGHAEGDAALKSFAHLLCGSVREMDLTARMGGDEFVAAGVVEHEGDAHLFAQRLLVSVMHHNERSEKNYQLNVSMGIVLKQPDACSDLDSVIREADEKMYENKKGS